ncbi:MAG: extensin family protein [Devosia nanyangense]|uniref:Extensin family protein n=1 Tax=Devosia nanyangense TaxID=1228055 RepID=A0A933L3L6_9HYPH|nr:extensin family protein [Devosia nanyangense]
MRHVLALLLIAMAGPALAQTDPVPLPRERPVASADAGGVPLPRPRPIAGPAQLAPAPDPSQAADGVGAGPILPAKLVVEPVVPPRDYQAACPAVMNGEVTATALPPIHEGQCGLQSPLSLEAVSANGRSIPLNAAVITDCGMATALPAWIAEVDLYLIAHDSTRIETINFGTNYACRNVDNAKTGNLSFHAFADALDLIGFSLEDGRTISIAPGWAGTEEQGSRILRFAHDAACAHFTTVLGPEADAFHLDNMHIDLGCHGKRCTARLCQ